MSFLLLALYEVRKRDARKQRKPIDSRNVLKYFVKKLSQQTPNGSATMRGLFCVLKANWRNKPLLRSSPNNAVAYAAAFFTSSGQSGRMPFPAEIG